LTAVNPVSQPTYVTVISYQQTCGLDRDVRVSETGKKMQEPKKINNLF